MQASFKGKKVVVAGGSRGIGHSIALAFARDGAAVAICARGADGVKAAAAELERSGSAKVHAATCDLGKAEEVTCYVSEAGKALGGIDVLINNASGFGMKDDEAGWEASLQVDVMATVRATQAAVPTMEQSGGGAVVNISSISGYRSSVRQIPYAAAKAAVISATTGQALQLAPKRIRVNAIAPGSIEFPGGLWEQRKTSDPTLYQGTLSRIPWGRYGTPEEIANVALFLASDLASWITGQTIVVDGGQLLN